tara:strand:+ start:1280 stop:2455 length:1176 start_codon:yes stop_codon:yes gene_type:complete
MTDKLWDEMKPDEKYELIVSKINEYNRKLSIYTNIETKYLNTIKNVILQSYHSDADMQKNIYLKGVGLGYVTKSGYFRKYNNDTTDFETNLGIYGDDCPVTLSKNNVSTYEITSSDSESYTLKNDDPAKDSPAITYMKNNNVIKEGQNCKLNYGGNMFVYNVDESKYSSYEGCLKPDPEDSVNDSIMFKQHPDANSYDDCINATTANGHSFFSLSKNNDGNLDCVSYDTRESIGIKNEVYPYGIQQSISEQTITLFDNNDPSFNNAFKNTTNLFKRGYKTSRFGVFTTTRDGISKYANEGDHCFLKLCRDGNLKMYRIGKNSGNSLETKSLDFFDLHLGNIKDSNNNKFKPLGSCDENIGGYLDENSISVEWGKKCKAAGCFIYQDKGCTN